MPSPTPPLICGGQPVIAAVQCNTESDISIVDNHGEEVASTALLPRTNFELSN
jgi:hypothetical protein